MAARPSLIPWLAILILCGGSTLAGCDYIYRFEGYAIESESPGVRVIDSLEELETLLNNPRVGGITIRVSCKPGYEGQDIILDAERDDQGRYVVRPNSKGHFKFQLLSNRLIENLHVVVEGPAYETLRDRFEMDYRFHGTFVIRLKKAS